VRQTFPNKRATSNAIYFQSEILSSAQLRKAIEETLLALQTEVLSRAQDLTVPAAHRMPALDPTSAGVARG
jgi:hypothetical protein